MMKILFSFSKKQRDDIYEELRVPIHDGFNFEHILDKLLSVDGYVLIKNELTIVFDYLILEFNNN